MGFYLGAGIVFLLMLAVLELNKNTLLGFLLTIAATALFVFLRGRAAGGGLRFLCWVGWIALFALILLLTPSRNRRGNSWYWTGNRRIL